MLTTCLVDGDDVRREMKKKKGKKSEALSHLPLTHPSITLCPCVMLLTAAIGGLLLTAVAVLVIVVTYFLLQIHLSKMADRLSLSLIVFSLIVRSLSLFLYGSVPFCLPLFQERS
jgi:hypothetical protein